MMGFQFSHALSDSFPAIPAEIGTTFQDSKNIKEQSIHLHLKNGITPDLSTVDIFKFDER